MENDFARREDGSRAVSKDLRPDRGHRHKDWTGTSGSMVRPVDVVNDALVALKEKPVRGFGGPAIPEIKPPTVPRNFPPMEIFQQQFLRRVLGVRTQILDHPRQSGAEQKPFTKCGSILGSLDRHGWHSMA